MGNGWVFDYFGGWHTTRVRIWPTKMWLSSTRFGLRGTGRTVGKLKWNICKRGRPTEMRSWLANSISISKQHKQHQQLNSALGFVGHVQLGVVLFTYMFTSPCHRGCTNGGCRRHLTTHIRNKMLRWLWDWPPNADGRPCFTNAFCDPIGGLSENGGPQKHPKTIRSVLQFINNHCNVNYKYDIFGHPQDVNSSQWWTPLQGTGIADSDRGF